jgi:hypothetical protein
VFRNGSTSVTGEERIWHSSLLIIEENMK